MRAGKCDFCGEDVSTPAKLNAHLRDVYWGKA